MKSFKKFFSILFVCVLLSLTVCSDYISCYNVKASGGISDYIDQLTYYFLTITGAVNKPSPHSGSDHIQLSPVPSSSRNAVKQKIADLISSNAIYEVNGQYVFTSSAMAELYNILGNSSDYRVINDFSSFNIAGVTSLQQYVNNTYLESCASAISTLNSNGIPYIICVSQDISYSYSRPICNTYCNIYSLTSEFAYCVVDSGNAHDIKFYNINGVNISLNYTRIFCQYYYSSFNNNSTSTGSSSYIGGIVDYGTTDSIFGSIPFYGKDPVNTTSGSGQYRSIYCSNSFILGKNVAGGNSAVNQASGIYYFNNYNSITVDNSVVNNNNWQSVYNSYTTNVNNTYQTELTNNNGSDLTAKQIRQIMNTYLQPIYNAIDEGLTDIAEKVDYINEWLSKIYSNGSLIITRLDSIIQIITQNTGGSGSTSGTACAWSDQEVDIVLDKLSRIYTEQVDNDLEVIAALEYIKTKINSLDTTLSTASSNISTISSNTSSIVTSLDTELSRLATVLTKMDTIISKMGQNRITRPTVDPNIIDDLEDLLPESVLDDIFSPFAALGSIIETVVPFCYIGVAVAIMSNLSAEAEAPYWEIPFKYDSDALALHIDEKIIIDLSPFEDLSTILRLLFIIAFTISLMFFSLPLVNYMTGIFSGK